MTNNFLMPIIFSSIDLTIYVIKKKNTGYILKQVVSITMIYKAFRMMVMSYAESIGGQEETRGTFMESKRINIHSWGFQAV